MAFKNLTKAGDTNMDLINTIKDLSSKFKKYIEDGDIQKNEAATRQHLVEPFIEALGYDTRNPKEVKPEFTADIGVKEGEKVDYAIQKDNKVIMLIECKPWHTNLNQSDASQLLRYFHVVDVRFSILTNGIVYEFYSDTEKENKMDEAPFFTFDISEFEEYQVEELKKFTKSTFSLEDILGARNTLKYTDAVKQILEKELNEPSDKFVEFFASQIYKGRLMKSVMKEFRQIVKKARKQFISKKISDYLNRLNRLSDDEEAQEQAAEAMSEENEKIPTDEERKGLYIVQAILAGIGIEASRVVERKAKSYCPHIIG